MTQNRDTIQLSDLVQDDVVEIDDNFDAVYSGNRGSSAPGYSTLNGVRWIDSSFAEDQAKFRDGTKGQWINLSHGKEFNLTKWTEAANPSDANTVKINGDRTTELLPDGQPGRMVLIVQPTNGSVYAPVKDATYDSNNDETTLDLSALRSQDLDTGEGVDEFWIGVPQPHNEGGQPRVPYNKRFDNAEWVQTDTELDLTGTNTQTLIDSGTIDAARGGDDVRVLKAVAIVTTAIAANNTTPVVTIRDSADNDSAIIINTFTDGDAVDLARIDELADGDSTTGLDLTSNSLDAEVTTAAADSGTAAGAVKVFVLIAPMV